MAESSPLMRTVESLAVHPALCQPNTTALATAVELSQQRPGDPPPSEASRRALLISLIEQAGGFLRAGRPAADRAAVATTLLHAISQLLRMLEPAAAAAAGPAYWQHVCRPLLAHHLGAGAWQHAVSCCFGLLGWQPTGRRGGYARAAGAGAAESDVADAVELMQAACVEILRDTYSPGGKPEACEGACLLAGELLGLEGRSGRLAEQGRAFRKALLPLLSRLLAAEAAQAIGLYASGTDIDEPSGGGGGGGGGGEGDDGDGDGEGEAVEAATDAAQLARIHQRVVEHLLPQLFRAEAHAGAVSPLAAELWGGYCLPVLTGDRANWPAQSTALAVAGRLHRHIFGGSGGGFDARQTVKRSANPHTLPCFTLRLVICDILNGNMWVL